MMTNIILIILGFLIFISIISDWILYFKKKDINIKTIEHRKRHIQVWGEFIGRLERLSNKIK